MNAVTVYVNTAKLVLQSTTTESSSSANICSNTDLPRQLLSLRQLLSCVVCCRLATDPFSPNHGRCPHSVCRLCIRGQKNLHPSCHHCRDTRDFKTYNENNQLRCLLVCYKSLCEHLRSSSVFPLLAGRKLLQYNANVVSPMLVMPQMSLQDLIVEGASYDDILSVFSKDLPKPALVLSPPKQQQPPAPPPVPALVAPLSSSSTPTPLATIQQNIKSSTIKHSAPKATTPPTSTIGPISSLPLIHASKVKVETSTIPPLKIQTQTATTSMASSVSTPQQKTSATNYSHHPHLIQLNQLKNAGNITYIGTNTRGIVVPIVSSSSSGTTTIPLSIASARIQTLNRQLAQARALQIASTAAATSSTTNVTTISSTSMDTKPQLAAFKVSLTSTQPVTKTVFSTSSLASSTTTLANAITTATTTSQIRNPPPIKTVSNGSAMYSVLYTGIGNKITIKRKTDGDDDSSQKKNASTSAPNATLMRPQPKNNNKKRGCRCGNTTATPGKLTCCGQRCPCYVDSKSCIGCKCRGCRNPHRPDGNKVRPVIPELACYEIQMADDHANANELPIATTSGRLNTSQSEGAEVTSPMQQYAAVNMKSEVVTSTAEGTATLIPIRSFQPTSCSSPLPPLTSSAIPIQTTSMTQASLGTTSTVVSTSTTHGNIVQLDQMQRESLLIQNAEGKFQVVNLFTTGSSQSGNQMPSLQRLQTLPQTVVSVSGSNNFILPTSLSTTSQHTGTSTTTSLPQFILQSQHHQQQQQQAQQLFHHSQHHQPQQQSISTQRIQTATLPLHLQQQLKQNIITVHTIGSNSNANTSPVSASVLTPSSSPAPTTATLTLAPFLMNNSQNSTSSESCGDVGQRYVVSSSSAAPGSATVLTTSLSGSISSGSVSHHGTTINLKALDSPNV